MTKIIGSTMIGRRRVEFVSAALGACLLATGIAGCGDDEGDDRAKDEGTGTASTQEPPRLEGRFKLRGKITSVAGNAGVKKGGKAEGDWSFAPDCPRGACEKVVLRRRGIKPRRIVLKRTRDRYQGTVVDFEAPAECRGEATGNKARVVTTVTVDVAKESDGRVTAITARTNNVGSAAAARGCAAGAFSWEVRLPQGRLVSR